MVAGWRVGEGKGLLTVEPADCEVVGEGHDPGCADCVICAGKGRIS